MIKTWFYAAPGDEFSCSSGVCIPMIQRCNNINDCEDKSDEAHCTRYSTK